MPEKDRQYWLGGHVGVWLSKLLHWSTDSEPSEAIVQLKQLMASVVGMKGEEMINNKDSINIMANGYSFDIARQEV